MNDLEKSENALRDRLKEARRQRGTEAAYALALEWIGSEGEGEEKALRRLVAIRALPALAQNSPGKAEEAYDLLKKILSTECRSQAERVEALMAIFAVSLCYDNRDVESLVRAGEFFRVCNPKSSMAGCGFSGHTEECQDPLRRRGFPDLARKDPEILNLIHSALTGERKAEGQGVPFQNQDGTLASNLNQALGFMGTQDSFDVLSESIEHGGPRAGAMMALAEMTRTASPTVAESARSAFLDYAQTSNDPYLRYEGLRAMSTYFGPREESEILRSAGEFADHISRTDPMASASLTGQILSEGKHLREGLSAPSVPGTFMATVDVAIERALTAFTQLPENVVDEKLVMRTLCSLSTIRTPWWRDSIRAILEKSPTLGARRAQAHLENEWKRLDEMSHRAPR